MLGYLSNTTVFNYVKEKKRDPKWDPRIRRVTKLSCTDDGADILSEDVWFKPDEDVRAFLVDYLKGVPAHTTVTYRRGCRPDTKEDWERAIGMKLQEMVSL